jgi:hypothetical protein
MTEKRFIAEFRETPVRHGLGVGSSSTALSEADRWDWQDQLGYDTHYARRKTTGALVGLDPSWWFFPSIPSIPSIFFPGNRPGVQARRISIARLTLD